jgi:hypothetical protein
MIIRPDLKPLYLVMILRIDMIDRSTCLWYILLVYGWGKVLGYMLIRGKQNYLVLSLEDPKVNILVFR